MTDIIGLKKDVEKLLEQSFTLFGKVKSKGYFPKECEESHKEIEKRRNHLKSMNAKMLIMAPMKAGKSTLINAICGKRILPTRNTGMTTIPTEIIFKKEKTEPHLELNGSSVFFENLFNSIKHSPHDWIVNQYAHLEENINDIESATNFKSLIENKTVEEQLFILNDLVRINSIRDSKAILSLPAIPSVSSSFYGEDPIYKGNNEISNSIGTLTIIDAPGKNESGINHQLEQFILSLTDNIHMVLLVFDYTQLKSLASEEISNEVKRISKVIGEDKIYIIINKIDQRGNEHDSNIEQTIKSIKAGMDFITEDKIFEVSARYGFAANTFMSERDTLTEENFKEKEVCKYLANVIWPTSIEDFEEIEFDKFCTRAKKVHEKSQLGLFLDKALRTIIKNIAPDLIRLGTTSITSKNKEMINILSNSLTASKKSISEIQQELNELNSDKMNAQSIKEGRNSVTDFLINSENQINESFTVLNNELTEVIKQVLAVNYDYYNKEKYYSPKPSYDVQGTGHDETMVFENKAKAENMNYSINSKIKESINTRIEEETKKVTEAIKKDFENYCEEINKKIQPLKEKINKRLLGLDFKFEEKKYSRISVQYDYIKESVRKISNSRKESKWFNLFDFFDGEWAWKTVEEVKSVTDYEINLKSYKEAYLKKIMDLSEARKKNIKTNLEKSLNEFIEKDFNDLLNSIDACISSLDNSIKTKHYDQKEQQKVYDDYSLFIKEFEFLNAELETQQELLPNAVKGANHV